MYLTAFSKAFHYCFARRGPFFTRTIRIGMKMTFILLFCCALHVCATGLSQQVTLRKNNVTLEEVFKEIRRQTGFNFLITSASLQYAKRVSLDVQKASLSEVMAICAKDQDFSYQIVGKSIVVKAKSNYTLQYLSPDFAVVRGKVVNEKMEPLVGASVKVKGENRGVQTDKDGNFLIAGNVAGFTVLISYLGYELREATLKGPNLNMIVMKATSSELDNVQITAYGTTTKRMATGNITTISAKEIAKSPARNVIEIIQGQVPGLFVQQQSGLPGTPFNMMIRGKQTFSGNSQPLIIVDGVAYPTERLPLYQPSGVTDQNYNNILKGGSPLDYLDPSIIASIEVLKDADATSIYGSRGAYGVILITTKKGKAGPARFDLTAATGVTVRGTAPQMLNTEEYLMLRREAKKNDNAAITAADNDLNGNWPQDRYTNWVKELTGNHATIQRVNGTYSGGTGLTNFLIGGNYRRQTNIQLGKGAVKDGGVNFNVNNRTANNKLNISLSGSYSVTTNDMIPYDFSSGSSTTRAPNAPKLFLPDGSLNWEQNSNPAAAMNLIYKNTTNNLTSSLDLSYEPVKGLIVKATASYNNISAKELRAQPSTFYNPGTAYQTTSTLNLYNVRNFTLDPTISYSRKLGSKGRLSVTTGATLQDRLTYSTYTTGNNFLSDAMLYNPSFADALTATGQPNISTVYNQFPNKYIGFLGIINYNWADKYLLNLNGRRDGSTKFGPGKQYGNFGSIGAGWILSKEEWFKTLVPVISFAKLRGSIGTVGGDDIDNYLFLATYVRNSILYQGSLTLYSNALANDQLHWENNRKAEVAITLAFIRDRLTVDVSYYNNRTSDQLTAQLLPTTTGFQTRVVNSPAIIDNWGYEMELNSKNISGKDFTWTSRLALTLPKNKLVAYPGLENLTVNNDFVIGKPVQGVKLFQYAGVNPETGVYNFYNAKGEKGSFRTLVDPVTLNENTDRTAFVDLTPKYYGSLNNSFSCKGLTLDILFLFTNRMGKNFLGSQFYSAGGPENVPTLALRRWQKPGDITDVPKASQDIGALFMQNNFTRSTGAYSRATYARLQNVQLAYALPAALLKKIRVTNLSIFAQGSNLLTISKFGDLDPENLGAGMAPLRSFTGGIRVSL